MKALLIDDERLARVELRALLALHPEIGIVGEAANATDALALCTRLRPDLLFLDIEMPGSTGFDLLDRLPLPHPHIVFVTAYNAFATRAFEVNALDYLLKPVNPARLAATLARVRSRPATDAALETAAPEEPGSPLREDDQVFVRDGDRCWFVPVRELRLLEAEGNHTRLHFRNQRTLLYRTLGSMETRLPASLFVRANRSQLVNRTFIEHLEPWFSGTLKARLPGGAEIEFSRRQAQELRERLGL
jgi:two-component system, LytTR family, response regulator